MLGVHTFLLFTFLVFFADVAKGSPLLPACFFPFYFLRMYVLVRRIWLGDRRDVQLVSYQRDLGVFMFPWVRRTWFLLAIALKLNAVFILFFSLFLLFSFSSSFFFFFFFLFLNHVIIDSGTKSCMQLALWDIKNLNSKNKQRK